MVGLCTRKLVYVFRACRGRTCLTQPCTPLPSDSFVPPQISHSRFPQHTCVGHRFFLVTETYSTCCAHKPGVVHVSSIVYNSHTACARCPLQFLCRPEGVSTSRRYVSSTRSVMLFRHMGQRSSCAAQLKQNPLKYQRYSTETEICRKRTPKQECYV